jgi:nitrogenase-stabilizing/protective protein
MIPELNACEEAEDFFDALGVPYDPKVLAAHRLPILRRFGDALVAISDRHPGEREDILRGFIRGALREAYAGERDGVPPPEAKSAKSCGAGALAPACESGAMEVAREAAQG